MVETEFFTEYGEANRYQIQKVVGKGSYEVVYSTINTHIGKKAAIKKINDIFEHVSNATRILREIKLLRLLRHPGIVEFKDIMMPPSCWEFKNIYVVFELMEPNLHEFLRALKYIQRLNVYHRDLKPKNALANADCKLKICDFILHPEAVQGVRNKKAKRYLRSMRKKQSLPFSQKNPNAYLLAICLMLAFDTRNSPIVEQALADPCSMGLAKVERETSVQLITKMEFEFERR
ncbi:hypothetical protein MPTK1_5g03310 [Marchantia polymorpha subsp. ruderalis]|uniref:Protein kinase domain-containing protein n=2 Tax=Marchantia polymorpha TaxID=3197 RepID=A0AAF6BEH1_MARPO|nr:hypothetical protein MARPO_0899s0001 [Marchantia polymorpha]BBN10405.1 hypothetical protein Mp_5g03310 [Marchantia polymorpha subsp. ruderalis]|eukprot:PTQ26585.1 hypothetical protein MARPO_0899s0001 [Marchantia polymorpha]